MRQAWEAFVQETTRQQSGPLRGVRVVEIAGVGPAPFAAMLLADLGADVIRVDRPGGPPLSPAPAGRDVLARGRPSVVLDLKNPAGVETLLRLTDRADILIEGFRPGVAERLGFGPDVCLERNAALVYGRMTGWGQEGPLSRTAGHDINYIAVTGALDAIGRAGGPPQIPLNLLGDFGGGSMYLVTGVLAALTHARATGEGQVIDAAIVDGVAHLLSMTISMQQSGQWNPDRGTNLVDSGAPFYDVYPTSDGRYMCVGAVEPKFYAEFATKLGLDPIPERSETADWPALRTLIADRFVQRPQSEWVAVFGEGDACVSPVIPLAEAPDFPHNAARGVFVDREGIIQPAPAPRFSRTPVSVTTPPVVPGADTREALAAWGIEDVDRLVLDGAAIQADADPG